MDGTTNECDKYQDLTPFQLEVWQTFRDRQNWRPPSYRQVAKKLGRGLSSVVHAREELLRKGYNPK